MRVKLFTLISLLILPILCFLYYTDLNNLIIYKVNSMLSSEVHSGGDRGMRVNFLFEIFFDAMDVHYFGNPNLLADLEIVSTLSSFGDLFFYFGTFSILISIILFVYQFYYIKIRLAIIDNTLLLIFLMTFLYFMVTPIITTTLFPFVVASIFHFSQNKGFKFIL